MSKPQVLHLDDDHNFLELFSIIYRPWFNVLSVERFEKCLEKLESNNVDLLVTDYEMPDINGLDVLKFVRGNFPSIPIIFYTGQGNEEVAREAFISGAVDYFTKDFSDFAHKEKLRNSIFAAIETRNIRDELRENKEKFREVFEKISSGVAIYKAVDNGNDFEFVDFNAASEKIEKINREAVIGKSVTKIFPGAVDFGIIDSMKKVWKKGGHEYLPVKEYSDGRITGWRENHVFRLSSGEIVAVYDDVTDMQKSKIALEESERRFRNIFDFANDSILLHEWEPSEKFGNFVEVNEIACKTYGYSREEFAGITIADILSSESLDKVASIKAELMEKGSAKFEMIHRNKEGRTFPVDVSTKLIELDNKRIIMSVVRNIEDRKKAQRSLVESEEKFKQIFFKARDMIFLYRLQKKGKGGFIEVNNYICEMLGYSREELLHKDLRQIMGKESFEDIESLINTGINDTVSAEMLKSDGSKIPVELSLKFIEINGESVLLAIIRDITERIENEKKIKHLNNVLTAINEINDCISIENNMAALLDKVCRKLVETRGYNRAWIGIIDKKGKITAVKEASLDKSHFIRKSPISSLPSCVKSLSEDQVFKVIQNSKNCPDCEHSNRYNENSAFIARLQSYKKCFGYLMVSIPSDLAGNEQEQSLFREVAGKISLALHNLEAEIIHRKSKKKILDLSRFPSENPNAVMRISIQGKLLYSNPPGLKLLRYISIINNRIRNEAWLDRINRVYENKKNETLELQFDKKTYSLIITPIVHSEYVNFYFTDITDRKKMEQELIEMNMELEDFARMVSHDIKNPLNVINGMLMAIRQNRNLFDEFYDRILQKSVFLIDFVDRLLKHSRAGKVLEEKIPMDLNRHLNIVFLSTRPERIKARLVIDEELPTILCDKTKITQVFTNLFDNSFKNRDTNKDELIIKVSYEIQDDFIILKINDNGIGIEKEYLNKIFQPVFVLKKDKNTGFGLAMVRKTIEAHKGEVWAESEGAGKGISFFIKLPHWL